MAKNKSNLMDARKSGNFDPDKSFDENSIIKKQESINHRKNVKISVEQKKYLDAIKHINGLNYDYEAIRFLIDNYVDNESAVNKRKIELFME